MTDTKPREWPPRVKVLFSTGGHAIGVGNLGAPGAMGDVFLSEREHSAILEEAKGALALDQDEYVRQVGAWKIIQRLEEQAKESNAIVTELVEALEDWIMWEREQVAKEGPYAGEKIKALISAGEQALAKFRSSNGK